MLSIDVGVVNLAMCLIDMKATPPQILEWEVDGVPPQSREGVFVSLAEHLRERSHWFSRTDMVLMERQPAKNKGMKAVENFLHGYMLAKEIPVRLWDPKNKIPDICGAGRAQYRKRKNTSIQRCETWIKDTNQTEKFLALFENSDKKDDLADTVMQALSFPVEAQTGQESTKTAPKKQVPRRPTKNQIETKYSKANLAWIYKNKAPELGGRRYLKDLKRYYKTEASLIKDFNL